ncbi:hypothetical protein [Congregibacter sp.]|uniref:hypothetical protein n=1 Tax=Congregibacter sp. TaxID=2744308 RepID=UPI003F6B81FE
MALINGFVVPLRGLYEVLNHTSGLKVQITHDALGLSMSGIRSFADHCNGSRLEPGIAADIEISQQCHAELIMRVYIAVGGT